MLNRSLVRSLCGEDTLRFSRHNLHRTSKLTIAPATTFCPAAGACETTMLAGVGCGGGTDSEGIPGTGGGAFPGAVDGSDEDDCADIAGADVEGAGAPAVAPAESAPDAEEFAGGVVAPFAGAWATLILPNLNPESCSARLAVPSG
jgi:hypothetical protein